VSRALCVLLLFIFGACTNPLELGERRYREGDRLAALETWRSVRSDSPYHERVRRRIAVVENESEQLVVRYKKRARYYERKGKLAESVLNYRLALKLQPDDRETLNRVQSLVRSLAALRQQARTAYTEAFEAGELASAARHLAELRTLDPFDPRLASSERQLEDTLRAKVRPLLAKGRRGFSSGDHRSAELAFRAVLEIDPNNETALGHLSYIAKIRDEEMAAAGATARGFDPTEMASDSRIRAAGLYEKAVRAQMEGRLFDAIDADIEALKLDPGYEKALEHLAALRKKLAPDVEGLIQAGQHYYQQEDLESALDQWELALQIDPNNEEAARYKARAESLLEDLALLRAGTGPGTEVP
jgi:tetratricopeptide (TPR) repeat protein